MTPLEEQVEKVARTIEHEIRTIETEGLIHVAGPDDTPPRMNIREASGRLARACVSALLPLEVTDGEARTKPYRCADCDQPHGPFNNIGSGQSNKPEVTYRLVCDRCWGPKPAALTQKGDKE